MKVASLFIVSLALLLISNSTVFARVKLENICQIYGQKEVRLTGMGLVVGLNGTGDGGKAIPTIRALGAVMQAMGAPVLDLRELNNADNVAIVLIEATIPQGGLRVGQKLDCYVSSYLGAESLRGGRLLISAIQTANIADDRLVGTAAGALVLEDPTALTGARIPNGVIIETDLTQDDEFIKNIVRVDKGMSYFTLLLDEAHASFLSSTAVADAINDNLSFQLENRLQQIAKARTPGVIDIMIPPQYFDEPVEFISEVLRVWIDTPHTQAKVIVNNRTKTVIVTAEVEISPTLIAHPNLDIAIGGMGGVAPSSFEVLDDPMANQQTARLDQLIRALKQLRVPPEGIIEVLRELSKTGKLHAVYEER